MAGTLTVNGLAAGIPSGEKIIGPVTMTGTATIGQITDVVLASGDNTIAVPAGSTAALLVLPATNAVTLKVRSNLNSGDGGMPFGPTGYAVVPVTSTTTSLIVNAAGAGAGTLEATFI